MFEPPPSDLADLSTVECLLASATEVVGLVGGDALEHHADAIDIFERLIFDAGVTPWRYTELCARYPKRLGPTLASLRSVISPVQP